MTHPIPPGTKECDHKAPAWGCDGCLLKDRRVRVERWLKENPPPPCPACHKATRVYASYPAMLRIDFECGSPKTQWCVDEGWVEVHVP